MITQSHFLRHCSEWFRGAWKWLPTYGSAASCFRGGAAAEVPGRLASLRSFLLFVILTVVVTSSFPVPLVAASSSTSTSFTALEMNSSHSLAHGRLLHTSNRRAGRFSTQEEERKPANVRRLSAQYLCRWKKEICEQEPISFLLGPDCCNSVCTNLKRDIFNCGTCGHICFYGSICCNGHCIDIFSNDRHCGACYNNCPLGALCHYGMCDYT